MMVSRRAAFALAALAALAAPLAAHAARTASPTGGPAAACTAADPCDVVTAIAGAAAIDEIILAPGDYAVAAPLAGAGKTLNVHGADGQPRPTLNLGGNTLTLGDGSALRGLVVNAAAADAAVAIDGALVTEPAARKPAVVDGVAIRNTSGPALRIVKAGFTSSITTTFLISEGAGAALQVETTNSLTIAHTTIVARGVSSTGLTASGPAIALVPAMGGTPAIPATPTTITATNTIVRGVAADVTAPGTTNEVVVTLGNSAFRASVSSTATVKTGPGSIPSDPLFVNPAAGDFHQLLGSPTIDAGTESTIARDFDGQPRSIGVPDIGADEFGIPATAVTDAATAVTQTGATLNGTVNPNGLFTAFRFEYGPTTTYGSTSAIEGAGADAVAHAVQTAVTGLKAGTTYHARIVITNPLGTITGADTTFRTLAAVDTIAPRIGVLRLAKASIPPGALARLTFPLNEAATVKVTIERIVRGRKTGTRCDPTAAAGARCTTFTRVATVSRKLAAGAPARLALPAKPGGKKLARGSYRLTLVATDGAGNASAAKRITLKVV